MRIVRAPAPRDEVPAHGLVGIRVAWPSSRGAKTSSLVCARLEDDSDEVPVREADEALLADAPLEGFDSTLPQDAGKGRRRQEAPAAAACRDESEPGRC